MTPKTNLYIRLTAVRLKPRVGEQRINATCGGPETLLTWLETQLGFQQAPVDGPGRVTEYLNALENCENASFEKSLAADRWATGVRLLKLRDELKLAGWTETVDGSQPELIQDLARAGQGEFTHVGESERVAHVLQALDDGQALPPHCCFLADPVEVWPPAWQAVLARLSTMPVEEVLPHGAEGSALKSVQSIVRGSAIQSITPDASFRFMSTRSETAACEFIGQALARRPELLLETVVYCEDDPLAVRLDACLSRFGLPTMGAAAVSLAHPVMQVLPLLLELLWEPVDPQVLLDFLTLPVSPIPRRAAYRLAESLAEQPGLGSQKWEDALRDLCKAENDPNEKTKKRVDAWLLTPRVPRGTAAATSEVRKRCSLVSQWAGGWAQKMKEDDDACSELVEALQAAAKHASLLGELAEIQGKEIKEPQLSRLFEETLDGGVQVTAALEEARGPVRVGSLGEINAPCKRLVWLGLGTADAAASHWSQADRTMLQKSGVDLDDGSKRVGALRRAKARGLAYVEEALLAVLLPTDTLRRWHPLWLAIRNVLGEENEPVRLEDVIAADNLKELEPFVAAISAQDVELPPRDACARKPLTPIPMEEEISSLSAILMDDIDYDFLQAGKREIDGLQVAGAEQLIPLKARAWLDLTSRKASGVRVNSGDVKKHKNDVFRLSVIADPDLVGPVPQVVKDDLAEFLTRVESERVDFKSLKLGNQTFDRFASELRKIYGLD